MAYLIGIDIGTSGTKTVLFNEKGEALSQSVFEYGMKQLKPGWAEQSPEDWWKAVCTTVPDVLNKAESRKKKFRIGLSDKCTPCDVGQGRTRNSGFHHLVRQPKRQRMPRDYGESDLRQIDGYYLQSGFNRFYRIKLLWVRNNEPWNYENEKSFFPKTISATS